MKRSNRDSSFKNEAVLAVEEAIECIESSIKSMQRSLEGLRLKKARLLKMESPERDTSEDVTRDEFGYHVAEYLRDNLQKGKSSISLLQESLINSDFKAPEYEENGYTGPPHLPIYLISCRVRFGALDLMSYGEAGSKKAAKEIAASETIDHIITIYR